MLTVWRAGEGFSHFYSVMTHQTVSPLWYLGGLLAILLAHELGHWIAAWRIGMTPAWPVLLPLPIAVSAFVGAAVLPPVGTLGALTPLRMPKDPSDRWLVAVAGILAGLAASVAVLLVGRALSPLGVALGHPLTPWIVSALLGTGRTWHPLAVSGWLGVLMTGTNLLPIPLLDGWHIWTGVWEGRLREGYLYASVALGGLLVACLPF